MGDGCVMEGIINEVVLFVVYWKFNKFIVIYDDNYNIIDGDIFLVFLEDVGVRFEVLGWNCVVIDNIYYDIDFFKEVVFNFVGKSDKLIFI